MKIYLTLLYGKQSRRNPQKKRASTYEKPVKFSGTFVEMIAISTGAGTKKKEEKKKV